MPTERLSTFAKFYACTIASACRNVPLPAASICLGHGQQVRDPSPPRQPGLWRRSWMTTSGSRTACFHRLPIGPAKSARIRIGRLCIASCCARTSR